MTIPKDPASSNDKNSCLKKKGGHIRNKKLGQKGQGPETHEESEVQNSQLFFNEQFFCSLIAGGCASSIAVTVMAPVERAKLIFQLRNIEMSTNHKQAVSTTMGCRELIKHIVKTEGVLALWKGNVPSVIRCFPHSGLNLAFKDRYHAFLTDKLRSSRLSGAILASVIAGGIAGCTATFSVYPLDLARTRMALTTQSIKYAGCKKESVQTMSGVWAHIFRKEGILGFYRGLSSAMIGVFIYRSIYFGLYDTEKLLTPKKYRSIVTTFAEAEVAAATASFTTYPFDTVRRTMMVQSLWKDSASYGTFSGCVKEIYRKYSFPGFYRGAAVNLLRATSSALLIVLYDTFQEYFFGLDTYRKISPNFQQQGFSEEEELPMSISPSRPLEPSENEEDWGLEGAYCDDENPELCKYKVDRRGKAITIF